MPFSELALGRKHDRRNVNFLQFIINLIFLFDIVLGSLFIIFLVKIVLNYNPLNEIKVHIGLMPVRWTVHFAASRITILSNYLLKILIKTNIIIKYFT